MNALSPLKLADDVEQGIGLGAWLWEACLKAGGWSNDSGDFRIWHRPNGSQCTYLDVPLPWSLDGVKSIERAEWKLEINVTAQGAFVQVYHRDDLSVRLGESLIMDGESEARARLVAYLRALHGEKR